MKDPENILVQQTPNVHSARQIRFTNHNQLTELKPKLKDYIEEAVKVEKENREVKFKKTEHYDTPEEFQIKLEKDPNLQSAFDVLTPGRQRAYLIYFSQAKRSATREARVEKYIPKYWPGKD